VIAKKSKQNLDKKTKEKNKKKLKTDRPCWTCGKTGHYRRNCPNVSKDGQNTGGGRWNKGNDNANTACFSVTKSSQMIDNEWIADSGASCHMAKDKCHVT